jgi:cytochrome c-type biogenesis protein CcmF
MAIISAATGHAKPWAMGAMAVIGAVLTGVVIDFAKAILARTRLGRESAAAAGAIVVATSFRHWGAQVAHLGLAAIVAGVAGSSLYQTEEKFMNLEVGKPSTQNGMTITLHEMREEARDTYKAWISTVDVTDAEGRQYTLHPQINFYNRKPEEPAKKVDAALSLRRDVYVRLLGTDDSGRLWAVQVILNPLVNWIWIGGTLLTLGGLMCLVPTRVGPVAEAPEEPSPRGRRTIQTGARRERLASEDET